MAKAKKDNELRLVREFNAPIKLVWEVFTEVSHQEKWWGPRGFSITSKSKDLKPEGQWIYTMHGPDGVDYPNITTYHEVKKFSKLIYDHGATESTPPLFRATVIFKELMGKTILDMTMAFESPKAAQEIEKFIKQVGGDSTWDRLGEYLEEIQNKKDIFIINRSFKTDINKLFDLWINPVRLKEWMGPTGSTMEFLSTNIEEGKETHYSMTNIEGQKMYGLLEYKKINSPDRLIYSQCFTDENKNLCKPPFAPTWPDKMLTTVLFRDEGDNHTRITVQWEIEGNATKDEQKTFNVAKPGMTIGWTGSFDKLDSAI